MPDLTFWRLSMNRIPDDLLELQAHFDQWRANRKYQREPIPDQLRDAALEMKRRYPPSLLQRVLKIQLSRLLLDASSPHILDTQPRPPLYIFPTSPIPTAAFRNLAVLRRSDCMASPIHF